MGTIDSLIAECQKLIDAYPDAENGPAHVVVSDLTFDDDSIDDCISRVRENIGKKTSDGLQATLALLLRMREIPEELRAPDYYDYDSE